MPARFSPGSPSPRPPTPIGIGAAIAVSVKEHEEEAADQKAEQADTGEVVSDATAEAMVQAPLALLGALFSAPGSAAGAFKIARVLGRNFPLVLFAGDDWRPVLADGPTGLGGRRRRSDAGGFPAR